MAGPTAGPKWLKLYRKPMGTWGNMGTLGVTWATFFQKSFFLILLL